MERESFEQRRQKLAALSDDELSVRFWELAGKIVDPLIELARTHTSPSIERSVLLRCGFSSLEAKRIVENAVKHGLLAKGAGNCALRLSKKRNCTVIEAGRLLSAGDGWEEVRDDA